MQSERNNYELTRAVDTIAKVQGYKFNDRTEPKIDYDKVLATDTLNLDHVAIKGRMKEPSVEQVSIDSLKNIT